MSVVFLILYSNTKMLKHIWTNEVFIMKKIKKNILIVTLSPIRGLNSSMMRSLALTKGLQEIGCSIDFITIPHSKTHTISDGYDFFDKINIMETDANVKYDNIVSQEKKGALTKLIIGCLRRLYHKFHIFNYTYDIAKDIDISIVQKKEYDLVISVSDPKTSHIAAWNLISQNLKYKKWIQYWGDPMTIDITSKSIYPKFLIKMIEKKLFRNSDLIVYASPITKKNQKKMFKIFANKMTFIPTPYIEPKYYPETNNAVYTIGYFGAYNKNVRDIMPLYQSCRELREQVKLDIIGDSDIELSNTKNINIISRRDISRYEKNTDLLVCMLNKKGTQIPGKVFHYAATNKPILLLIDGEYGEEIGQYFKQFSRFIICKNEVNDIKETLYSMLSDRQRYYPCEEFNAANVAKELIKSIN